MANPVGFHTNLNDHVKAHILEHVPGNYVIGQVARMSKVPRQTLTRWLKRGEEDAINNNGSIFAHLWADFEQKRGEEIKSMLEDVRARRTNWQATWELLKAIAREDFGVDAVEIKELLERVDKLSEAVKRMIENPLHGVVSDGREMDSKGDQEEGRTT